ncbi:MAG: protein arginine kinase [Bacillota bacterium]|jgi:protein arginine kinase
MDMDRLVTRASKWMEGTGPQGDVVLTSRIRLARNIKGLPFPHLLQEEKLRELIQQVFKAVSSKSVTKTFGPMELLQLDTLSPLQKQILVEKHLISPALAEMDRPRAVILNSDESVSIMVNEEDHLRIQLLLPALQLHETWRMANVLDDALEETLDYAFDESLGYLTTCPTNVGTGLRASLMVHLPALVMSKQAGKILNALSHVGLAVRGFYGEGTETAGNLFQISNQITLGLTEEEIINNLSSVAAQLIDQEKAARQALLKDYGRQLEDKVFRAYGILSHARIISSDEALSILSHLRLGIDLGLIKEVDSRILNELMVLIQPAMLQGKYGRQMSPYERDLKRAEAIQDKLKK